MKQISIILVTLAALTCPSFLTAEPTTLEKLFDECLEFNGASVEPGVLEVQRTTDIGKLLVAKSPNFCVIVGLIPSPGEPVLLTNSPEFINRLANWMNSRVPDFAVARVIHEKNKKATLVACIQGVWQVVAAGTTLREIASEDQHNHPGWSTELGLVPSATFNTIKPKGNSCTLT